MKKEIKKIVGVNFLERHLNMEIEHNISATEHVIVDKKDYNDIIKFFNRNPSLIPYIGQEQPIHIDFNTGRVINEYSKIK